MGNSFNIYFNYASLNCSTQTKYQDQERQRQNDVLSKMFIKPQTSLLTSGLTVFHAQLLLLSICHLIFFCDVFPVLIFTILAAFPFLYWRGVSTLSGPILFRIHLLRQRIDSRPAAGPADWYRGWCRGGIKRGRRRWSSEAPVSEQRFISPSAPSSQPRRGLLLGVWFLARPARTAERAWISVNLRTSAWTVL